MASKEMYIGVSGKAREVKKIYVGIGGIAREVKHGFVGVENKARMFFQNAIPIAYPTQAGALSYTGSQLSPAWSNYDDTQLTIGGIYKATNAGTYEAMFTPRDGYCWPDGTASAVAVDWEIGRAEIDIVPTQSNELSYTGSALTPTWSNYNSNQLTISGQTSAVEPGTYTAIFTPTSNYKWQDDSISGKEAQWGIEKATIAKPTLSEISGNLNNSTTTLTFTVTRQGDGIIKATSSDTSIATASVNDAIVTVTASGNTNGTANIVITVEESSHYTAYTETDVVFEANAFYPTVIEDVWGLIKARANNGTAKDNYKIGDIKPFTYKNIQYYAQIIGFDHDELETASSSGRTKAGITFQLGVANDSNELGVYTVAYDRNVTTYALEETSIYTDLPTEIKNNIVSVKKSKALANGSVRVDTAKIFFLGEVECLGTAKASYPGDGTQYEYYKEENAVRYRYGSKAPYWLRSVSRSNGYPLYVKADASGTTAVGSGNTSTAYLTFCFCF